MQFLESDASTVAERLLLALDDQFPGYARWYTLTGKAPDERLTPQEQAECDQLDPVGAEAGRFAQRVNTTMRHRKWVMEKGGNEEELPPDVRAFLARAGT